jgi:hypothetical protein
MAPPARYSELHFDTRAVPATPLLRGQATTISVPFSIHNVQGGLHAYSWQVVMPSSPSSAVRLAAGRLSVPSGGTGFRAPQVSVRCQAARVRIDIRTADPALSIGRWIQCPRSGPSHG